MGPSRYRTIEGTWEEIARQADTLAGKRLFVTVLENGQSESPTPELPDNTASRGPDRARAFREWAESHSRDSPILSDDAISRESIYFGERD